MDSKTLYPLQFVPQLYYRLWGGQRLKTLLGKTTATDICGESWEISGLEGNVSIVSNGLLKGRTLNELIADFPLEILGDKIIDLFGTHFPLLIKFIDAQLPLSVQVHPNDTLAKKRHNSLGKSEMWYVLEATKGAKLTLGFNQPMTATSFKKHCQSNSLGTVLQEKVVTKGEVVNVPAGLLHAIGGGILLAEIQQASDITYRVYDYDRIDAKKGKARKLHQKEAVEAIDFSLGETIVDYAPQVNTPVLLVESPHFTTQLIQVKEAYSCANRSKDSFSVLIGVEGDVLVEYQQKHYSVGLGQSLLLPAVLGEYRLIGDGTVLLTTV